MLRYLVSEAIHATVWAALALMSLSACTGPSPRPEPDTLATGRVSQPDVPSLAQPRPGSDPTAGYYQLAAVDTVSLRDSAACGAPIATAGALVLRADQRWSAGERAQPDCARAASVLFDSGSYSWRGDTLELQSTSGVGDGGTGLRRGDTLMVDFGMDALYVYVRRP